MKEFVQITNGAKVAITVTMGLNSIDATNRYSPVKDRLNVKPAWTRTCVTIYPGVGLYPSEIKNWDDVKAYVATKKFSLPIETDGEGFDEETINKARNVKKKLLNAIKKYQDDKKRNDDILEADKERAKREG